MSFPRWSTDLAKRRLRRSRGSVRPEGLATPQARPLVLAREVAGRRVVEHACDRALAAGVRSGFTVTQARALVPDDELLVLAHDPEREARSLRALTEWATRFSPIVSSDPPDGLLLDVGGCERLYGGEAALLDHTVDSLRRLGLHVRGAIASTAGCAQALARFGRRSRSIVPLGREREALFPLPVRALRPDETFAAALEEVGVRTVAQLLELERKDLAARFGPDLLLLVDRALGGALEALDPVRSVAAPRAESAFPGPVNRLEVIQHSVHHLLDALCHELAEREHGARELVVELTRSDLGPWRTGLTLSRPSRDPAHLWKLLEPKLERAHLGYGVEAVVVSAPRTGPLRPQQMSRWSEEEDGRTFDGQLAELIDTLAGRLGPERTVRFEPVETHVPERAFRRFAARSAPTAKQAEAHPHPSERPPRLFSPPEPARVRTLTGSPSDHDLPSHLHWRFGAGELITHFGPERVALPWWAEHRSGTRDYFRVQDSGGRWLWLFRELETGGWFVHGEWG